MTNTTPDHVARSLLATDPVWPAHESARRAIDVTARLFAVSVEELTGSRTRKAVQARQVAMTVVRANTDLSLPELGAVFGRDHATVHASIERVLTTPLLRRWAAAVNAELATPAPARPRPYTCRHRTERSLR